MNRGTVETLARAALQNLEAHSRRIDDLNVFPVPDGDTGRNLVFTLRKIVEAIEESEASTPAGLAADASAAAFRAGKGNSGVIFAEIVRGAARVLGTEDAPPSPELLARALRAGADAAYRAVERLGPVEGTILTVAREMAEEAERPEQRAHGVPEVLRAVLARGEDALARTPELNATLARAGVVDAGGAGLVEIVRGLVLALSGEPLPEAQVGSEELGLDAIHQELSRYRYCTSFVVEAERLDRRALEERLERLGDSLLVVGDSSALKVHVHTDDPGAALGIATAAGAIDEVEIANMHAQTKARERRLEDAALGAAPALATGLVVVCRGAGLRALFEAERATVVDGGATMNPSVDDLARAIEGTPATDVIVLPNDSNVLLAAEAAAAAAHGKRVRVVPSRSVQAGFALLANYSSALDAEEIEARMREGLASLETGDVAIAEREATVDGIAVRTGDYLGLVGGKAVAAGNELQPVALAVIEGLLAGDRSWLGVVTGDGAADVDGLVDRVRNDHPGLDVEVHDGGQPHYPLLLVSE